jgi:5,10-methylenetetrahydromethanopterin reductase
VLDGEGTDREHARLLAGPSWGFADHGAYEFGGPSAVPAPTGSVE